MFELHHGDSLDVLRGMADNSIDAIVTDPPYGLSFMGKRWDYDVPSEELWRECLRVLKPGGHLLAFAGTRTQHRMAVRIEDAGFEIRDMIAWVYGSGFPKSHDVSKAIDKAAGAEREVVGKRTHVNGGGTSYELRQGPRVEVVADITAPATDAARQWHGWGTALKPALEPITVARKPLIGTVAENVLTWGTGGVNVDGCRVEGAGPSGLRPYTRNTTPDVYALGMAKAGREVTYTDHPSGRWPANLIHDGSDEVVGLFPDTGKAKPARIGPRGGKLIHDGGWDKSNEGFWPADAGGSAARFFYCAKASKADRDEGLHDFPAVRTGGMLATQDGSMLTGSGNERTTTRSNHHPTVKPTDLMRYLCRLVTPPGGTVLDPFMGSGSTGKAAVLEGFNFIGIEREAEYIDIARARIDHVTKEPNLWQS